MRPNWFERFRVDVDKGRKKIDALFIVCRVCRRVKICEFSDWKGETVTKSWQQCLLSRQCVRAVCLLSSLSASLPPLPSGCLACLLVCVPGKFLGIHSGNLLLSMRTDCHWAIGILSRITCAQNGAKSRVVRQNQLLTTRTKLSNVCLTVRWLITDRSLILTQHAVRFDLCRNVSFSSFISFSTLAIGSTY